MSRSISMQVGTPKESRQISSTLSSSTGEFMHSSVSAIFNGMVRYRQAGKELL